jgi:conjugal transfer/type IV secretion protein DotA/TraY
MDHMGYGADANMSEVNPLAELAIIGDNLMTHSVALFGMAGALFAAGDDGKFIFLALLLASFASIGFVAGIVLLYVTPLMPFIHFLFAVVAWIMSILEALISIPLVAVAHLTTKGEGVSGDLARTSYFMIFSIFLRPVLLIIGMVVALLMLSVAIGVLNDLFKSAITGYMGNKVNGGFSVIMYTIMYVAIAFSLCNMCFKLIEDVPNRALTWIGQSGAREVTHDEQVARILGKSGDDIFVGGFVKNVQQSKGLLKGGVKK